MGHDLYVFLCALLRCAVDPSRDEGRGEVHAQVREGLGELSEESAVEDLARCLLMSRGAVFNAEAVRLRVVAYVASEPFSARTFLAPGKGFQESLKHDRVGSYLVSRTRWRWR